MQSKYLDTLIKLSELPRQNEHVHTGFCKITDPNRMASRPCYDTSINCYGCIYGKPQVKNENIKIREHIDTTSRTSINECRNIL